MTGWFLGLWRWLGRYGWVVCFAGLCTAIYANAVSHKEEIIANLDRQFNALQAEKKGLLETQQDLNRQIDSQDDPAWIELTLMKVLGLVPEGQSKVYFHPESSAPLR